MKNEALNSVKKVNDTTEDDNYFDISYNFYIILSWSIIIIIMFVSFENILEINYSYGIAFVLILVAIGYGIEVFIARNYNSQNHTSYRQNVIKYLGIPITIFALVIILILGIHNAHHYMYPSAVFSMSFSTLTTGLVLNKSYFQHASMFSFAISICMFVGFLYFGENAFHHTEKYISSVACSIPLLYIAIMTEGLKK